MPTAAVEPSKVLILDDEVAVARNLAICVGEGGQFKTDEISNLRDLKKRLVDEFDAASVDWEWHGSIRGPDIISDIRAKDQSAGIVIFTKHEHSVDEARNSGADFVLVKNPYDDLEEFREAVQQAARLGLARKILRELTVLDRSKDTLRADAGDGRDLREAAVWTAMEHRARSAEPICLIRLLIRRGWWAERAFRAAEYVRQPVNGKLAFLAESAFIRDDELASMFSLGELDKPDAALEPGDELRHQAVSVLAFILRLADYDLSIMPYYARVTDYFDHSSTPPPWDRQGLIPFLLHSTRPGFSQALSWIREH